MTLCHILPERRGWVNMNINLIYSWTGWGVSEFIFFPRGISLKVNVKARLKFELAYYSVAVKYICTSSWGLIYLSIYLYIYPHTMSDAVFNFFQKSLWWHWYLAVLVFTILLNNINVTKRINALHDHLP